VTYVLADESLKLPLILYANESNIFGEDTLSAENTIREKSNETSIMLLNSTINSNILHCSVSKVTNLMAWACLASEEEILLFVTLSKRILWPIQSCVQCLQALFLRIKLECSFAS